MTVDGYNNTYDPAEISEAGIDLSVSLLTNLVPFAAIIVIIALYKFITRKH